MSSENRLFLRGNTFARKADSSQTEKKLMGTKKATAPKRTRRQRIKEFAPEELAGYVDKVLVREGHDVDVDVLSFIRMYHAGEVLVNEEIATLIVFASCAVSLMSNGRIATREMVAQLISNVVPVHLRRDVRSELLVETEEVGSRLKQAR